jgi:para-aminobenzoate synthetase / 4-amino-4-deoxychorismate lyase
LLESERKETATLEQLSATLSRDGSLWFESAFCKGEQGGALLFSEPLEVVTLDSLCDIELFFKTLEKKLDQGCFLAGWMSYEAGYAFEPSVFPVAAANLPPLPLAWFGVYREPEHISPDALSQLFSEDAPAGADALQELSFNLTREEYTSTIRKIKEEIAAGNVYQVNFTGRYRFSSRASSLSLFSRLRTLQPSSYTAWLNCGERVILSFSPELFFRRSGPVIETMPMKGTAQRGNTIEEDDQLREELALCKKNRAENLMIVDLLRNDLGRICRPGSVKTGGLFVTETYPTLHQMVSTIRGEEKENVGLYELFRALYPSGSITGAPKIKAMNLIRAHESEPRGVYTGTIGFITPTRDMLFNVAIRTMELSGEKGIYGSGSGIVWDSDPEEEYRECRLKAKILPGIQSSDLQLFESILWCGSYFWLEEHLDRMAESAASLGFPWNKAAAHLLLDQFEEELCRSGARVKVRLNLTIQGSFTARHEPVPVPQTSTPVRISLAAQPSDSSRPLLYHKTTRRELYDRYLTLARQTGFDEVIFLNERGEVSEGAISNIFIRKGHQFYTPPIQSGLLNGIFRRYFLATRPFAFEKTLTLADLGEADMIYIANSVRGLRPALFSGDEILLPAKG